MCSRQSSEVGTLGCFQECVRNYNPCLTELEGATHRTLCEAAPSNRPARAQIGMLLQAVATAGLIVTIIVVPAENWSLHGPRGAFSFLLLQYVLNEKTKS